MCPNVYEEFFIFTALILFRVQGTTTCGLCVYIIYACAFDKSTDSQRSDASRCNRVDETRGARGVGYGGLYHTYGICTWNMCVCGKRDTVWLHRGVIFIWNYGIHIRPYNATHGVVEINIFKKILFSLYRQCSKLRKRYRFSPKDRYFFFLGKI